MTCTEDLGKVNVTLQHIGIVGGRKREVQLTVTWVSCGVYQVEYWRPQDAQAHYVVVAEDWYPDNVHISFTPEEFDKAWELFPAAPKHPRDQCYKPYYEDYRLDGGMFDFEHDSLFQAYKDPHDGVERVCLVSRLFEHGLPSTSNQVLGLSLEDFKKLKELIDSKKDMIFYSGVRFASNPLDKLWPKEEKKGDEPSISV